MNIQVDSKKIKKGDTFVAIKGINHDGHDYIEEAIKNGASKIVAMKGNYDVETLIVPDTREYLIKYLDDTYKDELKDLKLIGITGTNGKTTTCFLIEKILNNLNIKCAYIGTLGFYMDDKVKDLSNTTPDLLDIYEMLIQCKKNGYNYVTMEVSSHALDINRIGNLKFDFGIFTNLTQDHLDYHKTMENYALSKQKLFNRISENGISIINYDDEYKNYFLKNNSITYGFTGGNYKIDSYNMTIDGINFGVRKDNELITFNTNLIGKHNIYNLLVTIIVLDKMGFDFETIKSEIKKVKSPNGRMDTICFDDKMAVIDYAHTPDAVSKIITSVKDFCKGKIITIIGCGGNRDKTKRPIMADISTSLSDHVIFTSDNPRFENPSEIINDMVCKLNVNNYEIIEDRMEAIKKGVQLLQKNDILLVLGKGHENYQIINDEKKHFDDKEEVLKLIRR